MSDFERVTAVTATGADRYGVTLDAGWTIGGKPNGGYLLAVLARAAGAAAGVPTPLAVSGHYLRAPDAGPAQVRTELVRAGRRVSTVRATLWQNDKPCLDSLVSLGPLPVGDVEWTDAPPPELPAVEDCPGGSPENFRVELLDHVEVRLDPATVPFPAPSGSPSLRGWVRLRDGTAPDPLLALVAVDAMPPSVFNLGRLGWAPTVELTCLLRGIPAPGWLRCAVETRALAGGWFDESATLWDSTGRLVAQSRQLALAAD